MNYLRIRYCVLLMLFYGGALYSEEKKVSVELKLGRSLFVPSTEASDFDPLYFSGKNDASTLYDYIGQQTFSYGTDQEKMRNYLLAASAPETRFRSKEVDLLFDFALSRKHSFGFNINRTAVEARNLGYSNFVFGILTIMNLEFNNPLKIAFQDYPLLEGVFPYYRENTSSFLTCNTLNLNYAYRFRSAPSLFDPYLRIGFGFGKETQLGDTVYRSSIAVGTRYALSDRSYLTLEASGVGYDMYYKESNSKRHRYYATFVEYPLTFGIGTKL